MNIPSYDYLKEKIEAKLIKVAVVGLGYVGLPLALEFSKKDIFVFGIENDSERLERLKRGESYILDVEKKDLEEVIKKKKFIPTDNFKILKEVDIILVCVPTPIKRKYIPDISFIRNAIKSIVRNLRIPSLVILESTTYPGTTDKEVLPIFTQRDLVHNKDFFLCFSPERIDPGNKNYPLHKIPKIVGGVSPEATNLAYLVYKHIIEKVVPVSSSRVAEMAKLLENTFRLVNIALVDELAIMSHKMNIDIWEVIEAAKTKPFGFMPFYPGPGVGGHCIPKDPLYLYWSAKLYGFKSRFIKLASDVINYMPQYVVERIISLLEPITKTKKNRIKILIIGVTYKKDIKDLRKSPVIDIINLFQKRDISVSYYDPLIPYLKIDHIDLKSIALTKEELTKFDCVVIATDHSCIDYDFIFKNSRLIFDTRNVYKEIKDRRIVKL